MKSQSDYCILSDGELTLATRLEWERWWFTNADERLVARSWIGETEIVTVCLGIMTDRLFKTEATGGQYDGETAYYDTLEGAMLGHERLFGQVEAAYYA